jgi:glutathione synthase/RimK-type ligase-like ATP-grasp enzyme
MKKVLIIGRNFHPDGKETAAFIAEAIRPYLAKHEVETELALLKDLVFDISSDGVTIVHAPSGRDLKEYDAVLMTNWFSHSSIRKDMALTLALYFETHNTPFFNTESLHSRSTSKLSQMMLAAKNGVRIPRTVFSLSLKHLKQRLQSENFAAPFIFKDAQASRGHGNYLLNSIDEIDQHTAEHTEASPFIAQTLIMADGSDYRFFVVGGHAQLVIKRMGSNGSHLNNTSAGATTQTVSVDEFSEETLSAVHTMSQVLHREVTGLDIMFDKNTGEPYFLEANPIPQIATGSNVELKLEALANALAEAAGEGKS